MYVLRTSYCVKGATDQARFQIASVRDLEQEFAAMQPCFAGKETEFNWQEREKAIFRIRGMLQGQVQQTLRSAFVASLKSMVEGILKAVSRHCFGVPSSKLTSIVDKQLAHHAGCCCMSADSGTRRRPKGWHVAAL